MTGTNEARYSITMSLLSTSGFRGISGVWLALLEAYENTRCPIIEECDEKIREFPN
jgi:hypothetical protein